MARSIVNGLQSVGALARMRYFIEQLGEHALYFVEQVGLLGIFLANCLLRVLMPPYRLYPVFRQIHFVGVRTTFVIVVAALFTGMVLALQGYHTLSRFGSVEMLGSMVGLGLIRELGPVLTALLVIGRVGSAICAELGMMRSSEQIDALECMAIDPYRFVMAPKYVAMIIAVPMLTAIFDVAGIVGGYLVGVGIYGVSEGSFFRGLENSVLWTDVQMGAVKSVIFGLLIVWITTAKGFFMHRKRGGAFGPEGVSRVTTEAVVMASVAILIADYLVAEALL